MMLVSLHHKSPSKLTHLWLRERESLQLMKRTLATFHRRGKPLAHGRRPKNFTKNMPIRQDSGSEQEIQEGRRHGIIASLESPLLVTVKGGMSPK